MCGIMGVENLDTFKYPFWGAKTGPFFHLTGVVLLRSWLIQVLLVIVSRLPEDVFLSM